MACPAYFPDTFAKLKVDSGNWNVNYIMCRSERSEESSPEANLLQDFSGFFGLHPQNDRCRHTVLDTVSQMFDVHFLGYSSFPLLFLTNFQAVSCYSMLSIFTPRGQGEGSSRRVINLTYLPLLWEHYCSR